MTGYPPRPSDGPEWVDPDAPTGLAPQQQRPPHRGPQPPQQPEAAAPPPQHPAQWTGQAPPPGPQWPGQAPTPGPQWPGQGPPPGQWPQQPPPQQSWPGTAGPTGPHGGFPGPGGAPGAKNRKPLIIGIAAAVAVVLVGVITIVSLSGGDNGGPNSDLSAKDTAKAYLDALSSGDAAKALSFGNAQPSNTDLLTDEILRKQLDKLPISNIRILDEDKTIAAAGVSRVHIAANFGQTVNDVTLSLKMGEDQVWKLDSAAVKIDPPFTAVKDLAAQTVTVFGKQFKDGPIYTVPGYQDIGSTNKYLKVTAEPLLLDRLQTSYTAANLAPVLKLNDEGLSAIQDQLAATFAKCQGQQLQPPGCPAQLFAYDAVDGTLSWGKADLSRLSVGDPYPDLTVFLSGTASIPVTYRTAAGESKQEDAVGIIGGDADISTTPPQLKLN